MRFTRAAALAVDLFGNILVLDAGSSELVKLSPSGAFLRKTGGYGWGDGTMDAPRDVSAGNGLDVYVADYGNHRILHFDRDLNLQSSTFPSSDVDLPRTRFGYPRGVATSRFGDLFVVDGENNRILTFGREGGEARLFGDIHGGKGSLRAPERIRISDADRIFVRDSGAIVQYDLFGNYQRTYGRESFPALKTFAVDGKNLYVLDGCRIVAVEEGGATRTQFTLPQEGDGLRCDAVIDFQIRQETLYLLTAQRVWMEKLPRGGK